MQVPPPAQAVDSHSCRCFQRQKILRNILIFKKNINRFLKNENEEYRSQENRKLPEYFLC